MGERDDELLVDVPAADHHLGGLAGYRRGSGVRIGVFGSLIAAVIAALLVGRWYVSRLEARRKGSAPTYRLDNSPSGAPAESRPRVLTWSSGTARLGLSRADPAIAAIELPDQIVELAPGCDHAQIKVDVRDGRTVTLQVVVGEIRRTPREAPAPDPGATAP